MPAHIALTIAGSDSSGGAGIQADLKTFSALGVYGASVICALTAQNTQGVTDVHVAPPDFIVKQIDAVLSDLDVRAIKIGMLGNAATIEAVAARLSSIGDDIPIVLDPVMIAASGATLLPDDAIEVLRTRLVPLATLVTPNLPEAARLLDTSVEEVLANPERAGGQLTDLGALAALIKGGHELDTPQSTDWYHDGGTMRRLTARRIDTPHTHGTGCTLSSAIAARLAAGISMPDAISEAKEYVTRAIEAAANLGVGRGHGPVHHFWQWWPVA